MGSNTYDPGADALYLSLSNATIVESDEVSPGIVLDFDADNRVVAIEVLGASRILASGPWREWPLPER